MLTTVIRPDAEPMTPYHDDDDNGGDESGEEKEKKATIKDGRILTQVNV